jgi:hypothetical protein
MYETIHSARLLFCTPHIILLWWPRRRTTSTTQRRRWRQRNGRRRQYGFNRNMHIIATRKGYAMSPFWNHILCFIYVEIAKIAATWKLAKLAKKMYPGGDLNWGPISRLTDGQTDKLTWRNLPSPTRINSSVRPSVRLSVRPSVRLSVHACRLGIERKMAQAQQFRSIILQNHESSWIVN